MAVFMDLLLWAHFVGLALGMGGGLAMSQVGPRLTAAAPGDRDAWWPLAASFSRLSGIGLLLLLITGPLLLWLKYGGGAGLGVGFMVKMALVAVAVVAIGLSQWGLARLRRGDEGGGRLMAVSGPLSGLSVLAVILAAVFTFH